MISEFKDRATEIIQNETKAQVPGAPSMFPCLLGYSVLQTLAYLVSLHSQPTSAQGVLQASP